MAASSQTPTPGLASDLPSAKASDSSIDQALTLLLADQTEAALRWGAAALQRDPSTSSALVVTSRLLERMGRARAAIEGLHSAAKRAIEAGNLPLAIAAIDELRALGEDVSDLFDHVSETFCDRSPRLDETPAPLSPHFDDFQPLSSFLSGPALASKAAQIVQAATRADDGATPAELPSVARLPLFSALPQDALRDLLAAFDVITIPAGYRVMEEGELGATAYIVARGEIALSRRSGTKPPVVLARLGSGAFFGEMALLSDTPRAASAAATRPSILLVATREALDAVARRHPVVAVELAAHCHRRLIANLGRMAPILATLPPFDRARVVEKFVTRIYSKGERLTTKGEEIGGLHLLASGAVAVVAHDEGERVVLATLLPGETVGEVELVLCRKASADAIALQPTVTLFLSREDFAGLILDHPALVHGLYVIAVRRDGETAQALESAALTANDYQLDEVLADESQPLEETRFDIPEYREIMAPASESPEEPASLLAPRSAAISVPPALPPMPGSPDEPARGAAVTAPFPPVMPPPQPEEAPAKVVAVTTTFPIPPPPTPAPPTPPTAPTTAEEATRSATVPRISSISPVMASRPPAGSAKAPSSRSRFFWELPPAAVLGVFAVVAVVGFALAAPFSNHVNTAAASGGEMQNIIPSIEPPVEPRSQPASESPPVVIAPAAPPPAPVPVKQAAPASRPRAVAATRPRAGATPATVDPVAVSSADPRPEGTATPVAAPTRTAPAPRPDPKAAISAPPVADEFGGRE